MTTPTNPRERAFAVIGGLSAISAFVAFFASGLRAMALTLGAGVVIYSAFELTHLCRRHWRELLWFLALLGGLVLVLIVVSWSSGTPNTAPDHSHPTVSSSPIVSAPGSVSLPSPPAGMIFDGEVSILPGKTVDLDTGEVVTSDLIENETDLYLPRDRAVVFAGLSNDKVYPVLGPTEPEAAVHALCAKAPETINPLTSGSRIRGAQFCFFTSDGHVAWYWVKGINPGTHQVILHIRVWQ